MFYPNEKPHMSPSALAAWHNSRSSFVKRYFEKEEGFTSKAMEAGKAIHKLIEAGMMDAKCQYDMNEQELRVELETVDFMGYPDSFTKKPEKSVARFVDYKSGKANNWEDKLPTDIKMRATAWLVWNETGKPDTVVGEVEYIPTTWNPDAKEVIPIEGAETEVMEYKYEADELEAFTDVIEKAIEDVNDFYEKWGDQSEDFISQDDVNEYESLRAEKDKINEDLDQKIGDVQERIETQMKFGGLSTYRGEGGTYSLRTYPSYEYPEELKVRFDGEEMKLREAQELQSNIKDAIKASKKNYELATEPESVKESLSFRKKR